MPPIRLMVSMFQNLKPILELLTEHQGIKQTFGKPDIVKKEFDGKTYFIVIEKTGFGSEKDALTYIEIGNRVHSMKF